MITLKTLHKASAQEVFDQASKHLIKQNKKSVDEYDIGCMYRGEEYLMCAAGCFISDDEYSEDFEESGWDTLISDFGFPKKHEDLILELQFIHDNISVSEWVNELQELAKDHNLKFNI